MADKENKLTPEQMAEKLAQLEKDNAEVAAYKAKLEAEVAAQKEKLEAAEESNAKLQQSQEEYKAQIVDQAERLADAEKLRSIKRPVVQHGKGKTKIAVVVNFKRFKHLDKNSGMWEEKTLADLQGSRELVEELIEKKSNIVTLIQL